MTQLWIAHLRWAILSTSFIRIAHPNYNISFHSFCLIKGGTPSITYDSHHNCFDILKIFHFRSGTRRWPCLHLSDGSAWSPQVSDHSGATEDSSELSSASPFLCHIWKTNLGRWTGSEKKNISHHGEIKRFGVEWKGKTTIGRFLRSRKVQGWQVEQIKLKSCCFGSG